MSNSIVILVALAACSSSPSKATDGGDPPIDASPTWANLDPVLEPIAAATGVPALAAAVIRHNAVLGVGSVGVRRRFFQGAEVTDWDKWHLGSETKAMTAVVTARLVAEGVIQWNETLPQLLPSVATMNAAFANVTLTELLGHRAGLASAYDDVWDQLWQRTDAVTAQRSYVAQQVLSRAPSTAPGSAYEYTNYGYMVAGAILEQRTGKPWEQLMAEYLFTPLGMASCGFGAPASAGSVDQPWGHTMEGTAVAPGPGADNPPALGPAGTVHCSLPDWARFVEVFLPGSTFLAADSLKKLTTPLPGQRYALGWLSLDSPTGKVLTHDGSNTMFYARAWVTLDSDRAVLAVSNIANRAALDAMEQTVDQLVTWSPPHGDFLRSAVGRAGRFRDEKAA
jgi:CubicO group peptidase (beta-lactamase class C family)